MIEKYYEKNEKRVLSKTFREKLSQPSLIVGYDTG